MLVFVVQLFMPNVRYYVLQIMAATKFDLQNKFVKKNGYLVTKDTAKVYSLA